MILLNFNKSPPTVGCFTASQGIEYRIRLWSIGRWFMIQAIPHKLSARDWALAPRLMTDCPTPVSFLVSFLSRCSCLEEFPEPYKRDSYVKFSKSGFLFMQSKYYSIHITGYHYALMPLAPNARRSRTLFILYPSPFCNVLHTISNTFDELSHQISADNPFLPTEPED